MAIDQNTNGGARDDLPGTTILYFHQLSCLIESTNLLIRGLSCYSPDNVRSPVKYFSVKMEQANADFILSAFGNDQVGVLLGGFDERLMHRLDGCQVLIMDRLDGPAAVLNIAYDPAKQAYIGIGIHKHFNVKRLAQILIGQHVQAFNDDDVVRLQFDGLVRETGMSGKIIHGCECGLSGFQNAEMFDERLVVKANG